MKKMISGRRACITIFVRIILCLIIITFITIKQVYNIKNDVPFFPIPLTLSFSSGALLGYIVSQIFDFLILYSDRFKTSKVKNPGENFCSDCKGFCNLYKLTFLTFHHERCMKCEGTGKSDWITNVLGKGRS